MASLKRVCLPALLIATLLPSLSSAQPALVRLTLDEALQRSVETSQRMAELRARQMSAEADVVTARASERPDLSLQAGYQRTNHVEEFSLRQPDGIVRVVYPDVPDNYRSRLDLQWLLYSGGRTSALIGAAGTDARARARDVESLRNDVKLETASAYWTAVTQRESIVVIEGSLTRLESQLAEARARLDAGFVPPSDVLSVEAQHSSERALLVEARTVYEQSLLTLRRLTGLEMATPLELVELVEAPESTDPGVAVLVHIARDTRPERRALDLRIQSAGFRTDAARAEGRPNVAVVAGVDYARPNPRIFPRVAAWEDSWDVGVNFSWSLFDGGRVASRVASQSAQEEALRHQLADFDQRLDVEVRQRWLDVEAARAQIAAARDGLTSATEAHRVLRARYDAGVATSTEVLDALTALLRAQLELTRAQASARLARVQLERALGRI